MANVVIWSCVCGIKKKILYDTTKPSVSVRCPNSSCQNKHIVSGEVTGLWIETEQDMWHEVDLISFVAPAARWKTG